MLSVLIKKRSDQTFTRFGGKYEPFMINRNQLKAAKGSYFVLYSGKHHIKLVKYHRDSDTTLLHFTTSNFQIRQNHAAVF